jgi:hypothetical protein
MWVIGGRHGMDALSDTNPFFSDAWYSTEGVTWIQATAKAGFSPRWGHSSLVFNNKMWVIAGISPDSITVNRYNSDVWYSSFGVK